MKNKFFSKKYLVLLISSIILSFIFVTLITLVLVNGMTGLSLSEMLFDDWISFKTIFIVSLIIGPLSSIVSSWAWLD